MRKYTKREFIVMQTYECDEPTLTKWVKEKILDCDCRRVAFQVTVLRILRLAKKLFFSLISCTQSMALQ